MADCPYARCIQERRHIRRELLRWTKNMVFVVGLERVAEELMGRRRWKQYQDTLYSSTRSESASQPQNHHLHHPRLQQHPALSTACNNNSSPIAGNASQIRQATIGSAVIANQPSTTPPLTATVITTSGQDLKDKDLTNHKVNENDNTACRIKAEDIKVEIEAAQEHIGEEVHGRLLDQQRARKRATNENGEDEDFNVNIKEGEVHLDTENCGTIGGGGEKRLKLDDTLVNRLSPLRENEQRSPSRDSRANEGADSEGTKEKSGESALERIQVTPGLLRVKKEEELQELPQQVNCGGGSDTTGRIETTGVVNRPTKEQQQSEHTNDCTLAYPVNRRIISPPPEDWKPLDKCYFCIDGKLPHDDQPPLSPQSESSSSSRSAESPMSVQVDPMAASAVVAAALSGTYPTLLPQWCLPPREALPVGLQAHQDTGQAVDQPLDLSAKPKNSQDNNISMLDQQKIPLRMPANIDPKTIFATSYRPKPRVPGQQQTGVGGVPVVGGGRRTYTEEELQAALRDIQSGKLGTRRAAVIYGIPRSTLRNKVYKLAMERERDASLTSTHTSSHTHESGVPSTTSITTTTIPTTTTTTASSTPNTTQNASATSPQPPQVDEFDTSWPLGERELSRSEADDKELSGAEEEKEVEKALLKPLLSIEDLVRFSALEGGSGSAGESLRTLLQRGQETGTEWPGFEHANIGPYIQKMLAAAAPFKGLENQEYRIPEVMRQLMSEDKRLNKEVNGDQLHVQSSPGGTAQSRLPMTNDDFNPAIEEEASDSAQGRAILKIPSYKPAGTPGSSKNNGEPNSAAFAQSFAAAATSGSPGLLERASPAFSGTSSPTNSLVGKSVSVNFRDVIAKSISSKFQEGQSGNVSQQSSQLLSDSHPFKRGRYTPPQTAQSQQQKAQSQDKNKPPAGGKGTRPKRGKYRNYDRDSLVEAVRAVQRGEMSVHRAGSYYGVPHSTLEYKVKERHLMRPRKRDQKQQAEDKTKDSSSAPSTLRPAHQDKKPALKPQKPFNPSPSGLPGGPNGLKMPFLEGMPHLPFPHPFNFGWGPTPPFMPSPFIPGAPNVPTMLPEQYFATQRMRGLQEQQRSAVIQNQASSNQQQQSREGSTEPGTSNARSMVKTTRDMAESLYEGAGANGSFLDNLIRSSLETGMPRDPRIAQQQQQQQQSSTDGMSSSKALIDQLCRNSRRTPLPRMTTDSSEDESYNRPPRSVPDRPERVPTVDLSQSPTERRSIGDQSPNDRLLNSPSTGDDDVHNGSGSGDEAERKSSLQLNHYPDIHNLYTTENKKSACDSKLIVDHSSQKTTTQKDTPASGLVVQLQRGYNSSSRQTCEQSNNSPVAAATTAGQQSDTTRSGPAIAMDDSVEQ